MDKLLPKYMAYNERLKFKPWLIQQISSAKYKDLEWIDDENKRVFKIPWTKKNYPHWEEHHEIFKAWAKYRSEIRNDPSIANHHISLMKSNFRTILNKTSEIEELKDFHQLGLQTGNYKVYKILTPEEGESKRVSRPTAKDTSSVAVDLSSDIVEIQTSGADVQWLIEPHISESWVAQTSSLSLALLETEQAISKRPSTFDMEDTAPKRKVKRTQATQTAPKDPFFTAKEVVFFDVPSNGKNVEELSEEKCDDKTISDCTPEQGFNILLEAAKLSSNLSHDTIDDDRVLGVEPSIVDALKTLCIAKEQLLMYDIQIKYGGYEMMHNSYNEMQTGYKIHYNLLNSSESQLSKDNLISIHLPDPPCQMGRVFDSVLSNMYKGLVIKLNSDYNLVVKRICLTSIFVTVTYSESGPLNNFPLPRNEEVVLFSYSKFLYSLFGSIKEKNSITFSNLKVILSVGTKMRNLNEKGSVAINLIPVVAVTMLDLARSY